MNFVQILISAAKAAKISGVVLVAICTHESGLKNIVIPQDGGSASVGICQVKHQTAVMLGYNGTENGLLDPKTNAKYAAAYLKFQYDRYQNWCQAVAAYNAGRYNESLIKPGYPRNLKYVVNVQKRINKHFQHLLTCDKIFIGDQNVAENHGIRRRVQSTQP